MSKRILIGPSGNEMLFRISPPGKDADNISHPSVFSSNGDYLKVHSVIDTNMNYNGDYKTYWGAWTFPALGYVPMAFFSVSHRDTNRIFYPNDRNPATSEMSNFWGYMVQDGRAWAWRNNPSSSPGYLGTYFIRMIIFKNRADRFTAV